VNSMSDLFHKDVPLEYIQRVFDVMRRAHWHRFQVLTKRADRLAELSPEIEWPENVWMGVSVENANYVDRIDDLRTTGAAVKFLSLEPLLGPLPKLKLKGIDWVIVGGESGPCARPMAPEWATDIRDQCAKAGVAFFFKQWGGKNKKKAGRVLEGKTYDAMPETAPTVPVARASRAGRTLAWPSWADAARRAPYATSFADVKTRMGRTQLRPAKAANGKPLMFRRHQAQRSHGSCRRSLAPHPLHRPRPPSLHGPSRRGPRVLQDMPEGLRLRQHVHLLPVHLPPTPGCACDG
jgi:hypothetical protein